MNRKIETLRRECEILVVGGGLAGMSAAIKMKEENPDADILIIDKATAGPSGGKANKGAGIISYMSQGQDPGPYIKYHSSEIGGFLNDQIFMRKVFEASWPAIQDLERWGVNFAKYPQNGKMVTFAIDPKARWSVSMLDHDLLDKLKATAVKLGVDILNKTQITELLTDGSQVVGATGFHVIDGTYTVVKAKAVVLACGSCDYMYTYMWSCARGDGIAAAYRAGAKLRGMEFANFYNVCLKGSKANINGPGMLESLYNKKGEKIIYKYGSPDEPDVSIELFKGMQKEIEEGNGPLVHNPADMVVFPSMAPRPFQEKFIATSEGKEKQYTIDKSEKPEITLNFLGEFSALMVDHNLRTTLEGLWAIGDTSYVGSGLSGACPAPPARIRGTGLMYAATSGILCAPDVVSYAKGVGEVRLDESQIEAQRETLYRPLYREGINPRELIFALKEALAPSHCSVVKSEAHMTEALEKVNAIHEKALTATTAEGDFHMLGLCQDIINMSLCARAYYEASLARKESRGFHYRSDYPEYDDANFLKWSTMVYKDGKNILEYVDVPLDTYPYNRSNLLEEEQVEAPGQDGGSVAGKWEIVTNTPMGEEESVNELFVEGDTITGTVTDKDGVHEIYDGRVISPGECEFKVTLPLIFGPTEFTMVCRVIGDQMNGEAIMPMGKSLFQGHRI